MGGHTRLDSLESLIEDLPELEEEWPDLHEFEREELEFEWHIDTHQLFGALEELDRGVSPWINSPAASLDDAQRRRYAELKRDLRERIPIVERLGLSKSCIPAEAGGRRRYG